MELRTYSAKVQLQAGYVCVLDLRSSGLHCECTCDSVGSVLLDLCLSYNEGSTSAAVKYRGEGHFSDSCDTKLAQKSTSQRLYHRTWKTYFPTKEVLS